jgi:PhnB protein
MSSVPQGYHSVTPYLIVENAAAAIAFYCKAFGAEERFRMAEPSGRIGHAELQVGDSVVMLADEAPERGYRGPRSLEGTPVSLLLYVADVDQQFQRALDAGAKLLRCVQDQFYGDRTGTLEDPFGHVWTLATHQADLPPEELQARFGALLKSEAIPSA